MKNTEIFEEAVEALKKSNADIDAQQTAYLGFIANYLANIVDLLGAMLKTEGEGK